VAGFCLLGNELLASLKLENLFQELSDHQFFMKDSGDSVMGFTLK
jgi:hypothetical protein